MLSHAYIIKIYLPTKEYIASYSTNDKTSGYNNLSITNEWTLIKESLDQK